MTNPDTIIFLHIPKAAGTTLNRILQQHQGDLKLASGDPGGSSFTIHLPSAVGNES